MPKAGAGLVRSGFIEFSNGVFRLKPLSSYAVSKKLGERTV